MTNQLTTADLKQKRSAFGVLVFWVIYSLFAAIQPCLASTHNELFPIQNHQGAENHFYGTQSEGAPHKEITLKKDHHNDGIELTQCCCQAWNSHPSTITNKASSEKSDTSKHLFALTQGLISSGIIHKSPTVGNHRHRLITYQSTYLTTLRLRI